MVYVLISTIFLNFKPSLYAHLQRKKRRLTSLTIHDLCNTDLDAPQRFIMLHRTLALGYRILTCTQKTGRMYHDVSSTSSVCSGPFLPGLASSSTAGSAAGSTAAAPELASSVQNSAELVAVLVNS